MVEATSGADVVEFIAGSTHHTLIKNGVSEQVSVSSYSLIQFDLGEANDQIKMTNTIVANGSFKSWFDKAEWSVGSVLVKQSGFGLVEATSQAGLNHRAYLYGTSGEDQLSGGLANMTLTRSDATLVNSIAFDRVYPSAYGGDDSMALSDSTGNDNATSKPGYFKVDSPDVYLKAFDFEKIDFSNSQGGADKAYVYDSSGDDLLVLTENEVRFIGGNRDCKFTSTNRSYCYSQNGGDDELRIYDNIFDVDFSFPSPFADAGNKNGVEVTPTFARFFGSVFYRRAEGFQCSEILEVNPKYLIGDTNANGAVDVNIDYDEGNSTNFYIEQQRYGTELILAGLGTSNQSLIDDGLDVLQWGLDQQATDGSFSGTGDPVHSTSLFMHALGLAIWELERFNDPSANATISTWKQDLAGMANWLIANDDATQSVDLVPYTHRYFLRAAGLRFAGDIDSSTSLVNEANTYFSQGVAALTIDGILPELGGFDINYQLLGLKYAGDFVKRFGTNGQISDLENLFDESLTWIDPRIDSDGNVDVSDSTRTGELGRNGQPKSFDYRNGTRSCLFGHTATADTVWLEMANDLFQHDSSQ
ncbi:MAG: hypothetical protein AAGA30_06655 [Planctomycetota bacterium]